MQATINRPLTTGDRLWADAGSRVEIQVGGAVIRMNGATGVSVLNLDDRIAQLQLIQGTLNVRVRRLEPDQAFEIDTPNLAFTLREPGEYRIEVDPDGSSTTIVVRKGRGEAYGDEASYVIDARQAYRFTGTDLREYRQVDPRRADEFDRWATDRDRRYDNSVSARYVSQDVVGYQDLDDNGTWRVDATYGNVWIPSRVAAGWAPCGPAIGRGSTRGDGPGSMTRPGASLCPITAAGPTFVEPGAGSPDRSARGPTTRRRWSRSWEAAISS